MSLHKPYLKIIMIVTISMVVIGTILFIYNFELFILRDYKIRGIDISHYQKSVNWKLVKQKNDFCILKATQGSSYIDPTFRTYWNNAQKNNIKTGAYHYFSPNISASKQFENFKNNVKLGTNDLPPILDVEEKEVNIDEVNKWLKMAEDYYGVKPIIYSSYTFFQVFMNRKVEKYPLWLYINHKFRLRPVIREYDCKLLQYNQYGKVNGIPGDVDLDVFLGNNEEFNKMLIK